MLAVTPGIAGAGSPDSPGFSVLGLSNDQSVTTLNGARIEPEEIPPDAGVLARVSSSEFDVSHGGFSGAELSLVTAPAGGPSVRRVGAAGAFMPGATHAGYATPAPLVAANGLLGGSLPGSVGAFRFSWSANQSVGRRGSLLDAARTALGAQFARDSVAELFAVANGEGVGATDPLGAPQRTRSGSAMLRVDAGEWRHTSANVSFLGNWRGSTGLFAPGISAPSHAGSDRAQMEAFQIGAETDFESGPLNELTATAVSRTRRASAASDLPELDVQLGGSVLDRNSTAFLGGNAALPVDNSNRSFELNDELSAYLGDRQHLARLTLDARRTTFNDHSRPGVRGAYTYASVSDFAAGVPASYYWSSSAPASVAQNALGASLGDEWFVRPSLEVQYGARLDADATTQSADPGRPWHVGGAAVSPRAGFAWVPGRRDARDQAGPGGVIVRGGFGRFRSTLPLAAAARVARSATALGMVEVVCVGDATPLPDWRALAAGASAPDACAAGDASAGAAADRSAVTFARGFRPPSAWRGAIGASFAVGLRFDADATYSIGADNPVQVATNVKAVAPFTLSDEAGRPVLVAASDIDARTGIAQPHAGRADTSAAQDFELRSSGRGRTAQFTVGVSPNGNHRFGWNIIYNYQRAFAQQPQLGFSRPLAAGAGDSVAYELAWSRAANEMRHQIVVATSLDFARGLRLSAYYTGRSGMPYTPVVAGDVDGDGGRGDPAFVLDPAVVSDTALARAMRTVLSAGPSSARDCLRAQIGQVAGRNSCVGPWSGDASLELSIPAEALGTGRVTAVRFQVTNVLAGVDALVHGANGARGWGSAELPDPVLLRPVGFDAGERRFLYQVNSGFGSRLPQGTASASRFSVSAAVRVTLGGDPDRQALVRLLSEHAGDSAKLAAGFGLAFGRAGVSPASLLLERRDPRWSESTVSGLRMLAREARQRTDSAWGAVAKLVVERRTSAREPGAGLGREAARAVQAGNPALSMDEIVRIVRRTRDDEYRADEGAADRALDLLTPAERRSLPASLTAGLTRGAIERQRSVDAGRGRGGA